MIKELKIGSQSRMNNNSFNYDYYPCIYMGGKWLEQLGYMTGHKVRVEISEDEIIIRRIKNG